MLLFYITTILFEHILKIIHIQLFVSKSVLKDVEIDVLKGLITLLNVRLSLEFFLRISIYNR